MHSANSFWNDEIDTSVETLERYYRWGLNHLLHTMNSSKPSPQGGRASPRVSFFRNLEALHLWVSQRQYEDLAGTKPRLVIIDDVIDESSMLKPEHLQAVYTIYGRSTKSVEPLHPEEHGYVRKMGKLVKRHHPIPSTPRSPRKR